MSEFPDIIKSDIINKEWDIFWLDKPGLIASLSEKPLLIITEEFGQNSSEELQLQKMLQACTLSTEQYNIIQVKATEQLPWHKLRDYLNPKIILLLGIIPEQLGISAMLQLYLPNRFNDRIWIAGLSLTELEKQPEAKKQLWQNGLKPVFVDKTIGNF
jgi:hypothetical protein